MSYLVTALCAVLTALVGYHLFHGHQPQLWMAFSFFGAMTIISIPLGVLEREVHRQSKLHHQFKDIR